MTGLLASMTEVASSPSVAKAYRMCVPTARPEAAPAKLPAVVSGMPWFHGPSNVSNWKNKLVTGGGAVLAALNWNACAALVVVFPGRGVIAVVSGFGCASASVITVTSLPPLFAT